MRIKIWVIGSLLLLVALTGLAQNYHQVITRSLDSNLNDKKVTTEYKSGLLLVSQNHLQVDNTVYKFIEKHQEKETNDYRFIHYIIWNNKDKSQRTYSCVLSYDLRSSRLLMIEIWKSRFNCTYYVTQNKPKLSFNNTRIPAQPVTGIRINLSKTRRH